MSSVRGNGASASGAFDHDLGIDGFPQDAFDAVFERHLGVGAGSASAAKTEEDGLTGDGDDFQIAAVGLKHSAQFFKFFSDGLFHNVLPFLPAGSPVVWYGVRTFFVCEYVIK